MIVVHHLENSRSQRVLWLLEELQLPYEVQRYARDPKTMLAPASLRAVHPLGKSPVITDDDRTIAETGAIVDYLIERYGNGRLIPPAGSEDRLRYTYWLHFAEGSAMPPLVMSLVFDQVGKRAPWPIRPVARAIGRQVEAGYLGPTKRDQLDFIENTLAGQSWFAGDAFSGADIMMSFPLERSAPGARPHIRAFLDRIHARPAYKAALEKGGAYAYG